MLAKKEPFDCRSI